MTQTKQILTVKTHFIWVLLLVAWLSNGGCYTFKGISIDPAVNSFFVQNLTTTAVNAPPNLAIDFTERLKDKFRNETRLVLKSEDPDLEFSGEIVDFRVVPVAPKPGEVVTLNRLEIRVRLDMKNNKNEEKGWTNGKSFQHFAEFSNDADLISVQDQLIRTIGNQLLEDIFNAAFNDW